MSDGDRVDKTTPDPARFGDSRIDHAGHQVVTRTPDMAGRPVVICVTCNRRLANV